VNAGITGITHSLIRLKSRANHEICDSFLISPDFRNREDVFANSISLTLRSRDVYDPQVFFGFEQRSDNLEKRIALRFYSYLSTSIFNHHFPCT